MININNVTLVGRLTKDIELRKTQNNKSIVQFILAVNRRFKQEGQPEADFISCVAWNQSAEFLSKYATKGSVVSVEGRLATRSYDKNGTKIYITEVVSDQVSIISNKPQDTTKSKADLKVTDDDLFINDYEESSNVINTADISPDELPFY